MSKARGLADLGNVYSDGALSNRNMIINGGMQVDQRNGGAAVVNWPSDRWNTSDSPASTTGQTNGGAYTPPAGFSDYLRTITTTANAVLDATDYSIIYQPIEGHNTAQLAWGTSAARDATISFWARSNITGVLGCCVQNFNGTMSYPITYTINVADTWEWKTITVAGPTTGTWNTDNTRGLVLYFGLGVGTTYSGTANVWSTNYYFSATGAADLTGTLNNYLAITGVQLELGDTATPFEHRSYGDELLKCQRYYNEFSYHDGGGVGVKYMTANSTNVFSATVSYPEMRSSPTFTQLTAPLLVYCTQGTHSLTSKVATIRVTKNGSSGVYRMYSGSYSLDAEL